MIQIEWKDTNDGRGCWANYKDVRLIVKEQEEGGSWWGLYSRISDMLLASGECQQEVDAIQACELAAEQAS